MNAPNCSWKFPTILKSVGTSLQPGRLVIALLTVTLLMLGGGMWDGLVPASVSPRGLDAGAWSGEHELEDAGLLRRSLRRWSQVDLSNEEETPSAARVIELLKTSRAKAVNDGDSDERVRAITRTIDQVEAIRPRGAFEATVESLGGNLNQFVDGMVHVAPGRVIDAVVGTVYHLPASLWHAGQCWFLIVYGTFFCFIVGIGGGALSRMEACQHAANERLTMREAMNHSIEYWPRFLMALVVPMLLAAVMYGVLLLIGFAGMNIPGLNILTGLLYGLALLVGFLLVLLLLGYSACSTLLVPAVAVENCEGADAMQRAWAYVLNKPLHMLIYLVTALAGLALGFLVVNVVTIMTINLTSSAIGTATFNDAVLEAGRMTSVFAPVEQQAAGGSSMWTTTWTGGLISTWMMLVQYLVAGWIFSYVMAASTRIYLLMRQACDGQDDRLIWWPGMVQGTLSDGPGREG